MFKDYFKEYEIELKGEQYTVDGLPYNRVSDLIAPLRKLSKVDDEAPPIVRGRNLHSAVEVYLKTGIECCEEDARPFFEQFKLWWKPFKQKKIDYDILGVEKRVANKKLGIAGTIDLILRVGSEIHIIDYKTTEDSGKVNLALLIPQLTAYVGALQSVSPYLRNYKQYALHLTTKSWNEIPVECDENIVLTLLGVKRFYNKWRKQ